MQRVLKLVELIAVLQALYHLRYTSNSNDI